MPRLAALRAAGLLAPATENDREQHEERALLAALFEQTEDLVVVLDSSGAITHTNPAFEHHTGWQLREPDTSVNRRPPPLWQRSLDGSNTHHFRAEHPKHDGSRYKADWSVSPICDRSGRLLCHVCIGRDVTVQLQLEARLRQNDKERATNALAAGMAHDFNNLLASMIGLTELCQVDAAADSRQARNLARILEAGQKAGHLVRQLLDFARESPLTDRRTVALSELLQRSESLIRATLPPGITLSVQVDEDVNVRLDTTQFQQVLLNLCNNAAYAMRELGGSLQLIADMGSPNIPTIWADDQGRMLRERSYARLRVIDSGAGIAPAHLQRIFDPFFTTKPIGEGTGLGLAAVQGIVRNHDGHIEVASQPGKGTSFSLYLPLSC